MKVIIDGNLYDTNKAMILAIRKNNARVTTRYWKTRILMITPEGNLFFLNEGGSMTEYAIDTGPWKMAGAQIAQCNLEEAYDFIFEQEGGRTMKNLEFYKKRKKEEEIMNDEYPVRALNMPFLARKENRPVIAYWNFAWPRFDGYIYIHDFLYCDTCLRVPGTAEIYNQALEMIIKFSEGKFKLYPEKGFVISEYLFSRNPKFWKDMGFIKCNDEEGIYSNGYYFLKRDK